MAMPAYDSHTFSIATVPHARRSVFDASRSLRPTPRHTQDASGKLTKFEIERRAVGPKDVKVAIKFCGICHSDLVRLIRIGGWGGWMHRPQ